MYLSVCMVFVLLQCCTEGYALTTTSASAVFNTQGITGNVIFVLQDDGTVAITAALTGLTSPAEMTIHTLPVLTTIDPALRSSTDYIGGVLEFTGDCPQGSLCTVTGDLLGRFGPIPADGAFSEVDEIITLSGITSIVGRSLLISNDEVQVVATIFDDVEENAGVTIYTSTFFSPVAGTIYFRQVQGAKETTIFGKVYHVTSSVVTSGHNWHVHENAPPDGYQVGDNCDGSVIGGHYDPTGEFPDDLTAEQYALQCTPTTPGMCELGDLSSKFGQLTIESTPTPYSSSAFFGTDANITLGGDFEILGRSIAIHDHEDPSIIIACAPIVVSEVISTRLYAPRDQEEEEPLVTFQQASPYENSYLTTSSAYSAVEDSVAVLQGAFMNNGQCTMSSTSPYNPFSLTAPADGEGTPDLYPLGDIPNKYNVEFDGASVNSFTELPLYGPTSLLSRTLRMTTDDTTTCATLAPAIGDVGNVLLKATYNADTDPVMGGIYLTQQDSGVTNIVVDLYYTASGLATEGHDWVIVDQECSDISSATAPTIFNPYSVDADPATYPNECSPSDQLRCQNGDLSGKHGTLALSSIGDDRATYSFIDTNIQLSGTYSITTAGSLIILGADGGSNLLVCSSFLQLFSSETNIRFSTPYDSEFDRVTFVNTVTSVEPLMGVLPASNILIMYQDVGATTAASTGTACATSEMIVIAGTTDVATMYADITQNSLCERYSDDECFTGLPEYAAICGADRLKGLGFTLMGMLSLLLTWLSI